MTDSLFSCPQNAVIFSPWGAVRPLIWEMSVKSSLKFNRTTRPLLKKSLALIKTVHYKEQRELRHDENRCGHDQAFLISGVM